MKNERGRYDWGTEFEITVKDENDTVVDISGADTRNFIFQAPSGRQFTKAGDFIGGGTTGQIECILSAEEINESGDWSYQLHFIFDGTGQWRTDIGHFRVFGNLDD